MVGGLHVLKAPFLPVAMEPPQNINRINNIRLSLFSIYKITTPISHVVIPSLHMHYYRSSRGKETSVINRKSSKNYHLCAVTGLKHCIVVSVQKA